MADEIRCIYCLEKAQKPREGEHVILKGLRGSQTIQDVCSACNNKLSKIDLEFLQSSIIAVVRVATPSAMGRLKSTQFFFDNKRGAWVDVVLKSGSIYQKPHICEYEGSLVSRFQEVEDLSAIEAFIEKFERGKVSIDPRIEDRVEYSNTRLVIDVDRSRKNRNHDKYYIVARSEDHEVRIRALLADQATNVLPKLRANQFEEIKSSLASDTTFNFSTSINAVNRCAAKMAVNFACHYLGSEIVLRDEFRPIREYIIGKNVRGAGGASNAVGVTWDDRFVNFNPQTISFKIEPQDFREGHFIGLSISRRTAKPYLVARVSVYESIQFAVNLGSWPQGILPKRPLPAFIFTPINGGGDRIGSLGEIFASEASREQSTTQ